MLQEFIKSKTFIQFLKFVLVGGSAFLIDFSVNLLIVRSLQLEIKNESAIANVISYSIALIYNYLMSSKWSFKNDSTERRGMETMIKFVLVNIFNLVWSSIAIWYAVGVIKQSNLLSDDQLIQPFTKILVTSFMIIVSFVLYRKFVFNTKRETKERAQGYS